MAFTARYDGNCPDCHEDIVAGDSQLATYDGEYLHEECANRLKAEEQRDRRAGAAPAPSVSPEASAARLARYMTPNPSPAAQTYNPPANANGNGAALAFFAAPNPAPAAAPVAIDPNVAAQTFFATPPETRYTTMEEEVEAKVERDRWDRPLIVQEDGSKKPYNRASSYGGQLDDKTNVEKWGKRQVVRGVAIALRGGRAPAFLDAVPERLFDPWEDQDGEKGDKKLLDSLAERAQDMAGSNLKSQLGTDIHYATELIDLGESLDAGLRDFEPERRRVLAERADAYYKKIQEYRIRWDSVETFGVQDELEVAGTWDRRGYIPWWPQHAQVIGDVKTSSTMDFAGITYAVQLATYAHMKAYDIATATRTPHDDMNEKFALIVHVERFMGGAVELYPVNIDWGWRHAMLARQVIVARREGSRKGKDAVISRLDDREALILSQPDRAGLKEIESEVMAMPKWLRDLAFRRWDELS